MDGTDWAGPDLSRHGAGHRPRPVLGPSALPPRFCSVNLFIYLASYLCLCRRIICKIFVFYSFLFLLLLFCRAGLWAGVRVAVETRRTRRKRNGSGDGRTMGIAADGADRRLRRILLHTYIQCIALARHRDPPAMAGAANSSRSASAPCSSSPPRDHGLGYDTGPVGHASADGCRASQRGCRATPAAGRRRAAAGGGGRCGTPGARIAGSFRSHRFFAGSRN